MAEAALHRPARRPARRLAHAVRGWRAMAAAAVALLMLAAAPLRAQTDPAPAELTGTLKKLRDSGAITLAHRADAVPFSYLSARGEPIGYTIDLCVLLAEALGERLGRTLEVRWLPVTADSRIPAIVAGQADLECGSTTSNLERQRLVAFSPTLFIAGTKLLVPRGSPVKSFRDLAQRSVAVTSGTTNEKAVRELSRRFGIAMALQATPDHQAGLALLRAGQVQALATDDVLLHGLVAQHRLQADFHVVGDYLSYDPYAVMFRKDDPALAQAIDQAVRRLAEDGEIERRYKRWFLQKLPSGVSLGLPMSAQLESAIGALSFKRE